MTSLEMPHYPHPMKKQNGELYIYDSIRKKYLLLTPEEWVRQQFICWLADVYQYPKSLMSVESGLKYNTRQKRTDLVVYGRDGKPFLLVECKAMNIKLTQAVCEQAGQYNHILKAQYLVITNGHYYQTFAIDHQAKQTVPLDEIPNYE